MVLVGNGRSKSELMKLLDVFIGEETDSFVSWLWDQLLYIEQKMSACDDSTKPKFQMTKKVKEHSSQLQQRSGKKLKSDVEYEKQELNINRRQHIRKYYSRTSKDEYYLEDITSQRAKLIGRSNHPLRGRHTHRWLDEAKIVKQNNAHSSQSAAPTSRLLQFALRDLITNQQRTTTRTESATKRLHKRVKNDASEDVGSVFLGRQHHDLCTLETDDHPFIYEEDLFDEEELDDIFEIAKDINCNTLDNTGNEIISTDGGQKVQVRSPEQNTATQGAQKILNISVNVNTWKPPRVENSKNLVEIHGDARKAKRKLKLSNSAIVEDHLATSAEVTKKSKKTIPSTPGLCSGTCTSDDTDTRTIFISNVHFATTKEILSHHFREFGDIRKSIILSEAITGQPTGSAIIEFSGKESAEQALSLNGTYFMSRVIKVVKGKAPPHDNTKSIVRPRISRYSLSGPIFRRVVPLPGGCSSSHLHQRALLTPKAHSLQWNREESVKAVQMASVPKRNFTYVRKID